MRYQLRYIRAQRTRSSPGAKHDDSPPERDRTNFSAVTRASSFNGGQRVLPDGPRVLIFDVVRLRRRKVAFFLPIIGCVAQLALGVGAAAMESLAGPV